MATASRWCRTCGVENGPDATFCRSCGRRFDNSDQRQKVPQQQPQNIASQRKGVYDTRGKATMKWRSRSLIILAIFMLVIIAAGTGLFLWFSGSSSRQQSNVILTPMAFPTTAPNGIPIPALKRTTYTNTQYRYSFTYPSEWRVSHSTDQGKDIVRGHYPYPVYAGDRYPFQVTCQANPNGLDAQTWFNQHNLYDTSLGDMTLGNGLKAYLSVGRGEVAWKSYILVHAGVVCEVTTFIFMNEDTINQINNSIINNFSWVSS